MIQVRLLCAYCSSEPRVAGLAVNRWDLCAHGPKVGRKLTAMMDFVEVEQPEDLAGRFLQRYTAADA